MSTPEQRNIVGVMAAMGIPHEHMRMLIINPRTRKPIETPTMKRHFAHELAVGGAHMDLAVAMAIAQGVRSGNPHILALYCRNRLGWDRRRSATLELPVRERDAAEPEIEIVLVKAKPHKPDEDGGCVP